MKLLITMLIALFSLNAYAQDDEYGLNAAFICQDVNSAYLSISVYGDVDSVQITPNHEGDGFVWTVGAEKQARFSIPLDNEYVSLHIETQWGGYWWGDVILDPTLDPEIDAVLAPCGYDEAAFFAALLDTMKGIER